MNRMMHKDSQFKLGTNILDFDFVFKNSCKGPVFLITDLPKCLHIFINILNIAIEITCVCIGIHYFILLLKFHIYCLSFEACQLCCIIVTLLSEIVITLFISKHPDNLQSFMS